MKALPRMKVKQRFYTGIAKAQVLKITDWGKMRIQDEHLYHGAALNQIAEHKEFTAINAFKLKGKTSGSAFRINDSAVVYLKYAKAPNKSYSEY